MARPLAQGSDIIMQDIVALNRMLRRVMNDPKRYSHERESLVAHLKGATTILLNGARAEDVLSQDTEVASVLLLERKPKSKVRSTPKRRTG